MARRKIDVPTKLRFAERLIHALDRSVDFRFWHIAEVMEVNYAEGHIDFYPFSIIYSPKYWSKGRHKTWTLLVFVDDDESVIGEFTRIVDAVVEAFAGFAKERAIDLIETEVMAMAGELRGN